MGKQNRPRCDAANAAFHMGLFCLPDVPKNESGLIQSISMGKSICHNWVTVLGIWNRSNDFFRLAVGDSCLTREECPCYMEGGSVLRPGDLLRDDCVTM